LGEFLIILTCDNREGQRGFRSQPRTHRECC
jgi:hypothetical protein